VGLEETLFPSGMSVNTREELEEERRLFYVAVTAIDLAGKGNIDPNSFYSAIDLAIDLANKSHL
jgi:superfamily I DNA/RNA helicase